MLVVVDVIGRETIGDDELCDWIDTFGSWLAGRTGSFDPASRAAAVNLKRFVRTLHLALCSRAHRREPDVRQARGRRPRHRPPLRRRADLSGSAAPKTCARSTCPGAPLAPRPSWPSARPGQVDARCGRRPERSCRSGTERAELRSERPDLDRLDDEDVAGGVVGDLVGDRAEEAADALHAAVADDDQLGLEPRGLGDQRRRPACSSTAADVASTPWARNVAACCSAICSAVVRLVTTNSSEPTADAGAARPLRVGAHDVHRRAGGVGEVTGPLGGARRGLRPVGADDVGLHASPSARRTALRRL